MICIDEVLNRDSSILNTVHDWVESEYSKHFSQYFETQRNLYAVFKNNRKAITDDELEQILMQVPLDLFVVSENLNKYRLSLETLKLKLKHDTREISKNSTAKSQAKRDEDGELETIGDRILIECYNNIITRVENEISFSRELIMSSKKLWDSRRQGDRTMPVGIKDYQQSNNLPNYNRCNIG